MRPHRRIKVKKKSKPLGKPEVLIFLKWIGIELLCPAFGAILGVFIGNEWPCKAAYAIFAGKAGAFTVAASVQQRNLAKQVGIFLTEL